MDRRSLYDLLGEVYDLKEAREEQTLVSRAALPREVELLELLNFEWVVEITGVSFSTRHTPDRSLSHGVRREVVRVPCLATAPTHAVEAVEITVAHSTQPAAAFCTARRFRDNPRSRVPAVPRRGPKCRAPAAALLRGVRGRRVRRRPRPPR